MKKWLCTFFAIAMIFCLTACQSEPAEETFLPTETDSPTIAETISAETERPSTEPEQPSTVPEQPSTEPEQLSTEPEHSPFYLPGVCVEDVICFFNEVCLDAEIVHSGNPNVLQKWVIPIRYSINGSYTQDDLTVLSDFVCWLNTLEGFPGIREAGDSEIANLQIHFCDGQEMLSIMGQNFGGLDGAVTFWYDFNEIHDATICYRTDIAQYTRNSVILEEIYNGLGPVQDTDLRPDSIIYSGFSEPQNLTPMDELILKLLYHPQLTCGMDAAQCEAVIRQLYY